MVDFEKLSNFGYEYDSGYYNTKKLSNGQTATILFFKDNLKRDIEYSVAFVIANKKKHIKQWLLEEKDVLSDKETGNCGLEGLIWAKKQLFEFEEFIKERYNEKTFICIYWTDNRRRNVYEKVLKKIGYEMNYRHSRKCLSKLIIEGDNYGRRSNT
jgi:hypothetical protein